MKQKTSVCLILFGVSNSVERFFWKFSNQPWYLPGKLPQILQLITQHARSEVVVKVDTKNKGLTFKCRMLLMSYSSDSLSITDQRCSTCENKTHKCFWSAFWNDDISFQRERAPILLSRSHCNLHNNNDEQPIRDDSREKASKFSFRCMLIVFIHGS